MSNQRTKPQTIADIKQSIEHCQTRIQLEQMSIDALKRDLFKLETSLGNVDRLFVRTKDIHQQIVGVKKE